MEEVARRVKGLRGDGGSYIQFGEKNFLYYASRITGGVVSAKNIRLIPVMIYEKRTVGIFHTTLLRSVHIRNVSMSL